MTGLHRFTLSRSQRLLAREQAAATWGAVLAPTAHTLAAYFHDRLRTIALDGETTVTLPLIPAGRDAQAAEGHGEPLRDTDPEWRSAHQSARKPTQACERPSGVDAMTDPNLPPDDSPGDWVDTRRDDWQPKPDPAPPAPHAAAGIPGGITAALHAGPVVHITATPQPAHTDA